MPGCCVFNCTSGYPSNKEKVRLLSFPPKTSVKTRKAWIEAVNRKDYNITTTSKICEKHFKATDFVPKELNVDRHNKPKKLATLKPNAVPSLYMKGGAPKKVPFTPPDTKPIMNDHTYGQPSSSEPVVMEEVQIPAIAEMEVVAGEN